MKPVSHGSRGDFYISVVLRPFILTIPIRYFSVFTIVNNGWGKAEIAEVAKCKFQMATFNRDFGNSCTVSVICVLESHEN